jgi:hypothetical protein
MMNEYADFVASERLVTFVSHQVLLYLFSTFLSD